jgi:hypothetical protein
MSEELNRLKEIGAQKIYEDTHIALKHVQSVIHESFEGLNKVQFLGFISILEREYNLDLSEIKAKGLVYFENITPKDDYSKGVFVVPKKTRKFTFLYIGIALILFALVAFFSIENENKSEVVKLDNTSIQSVQKTIEPQLAKKALLLEEELEDGNVSSTMETNSSELVETPAPIKVAPVEEVVVAKSLQIKPLSRLWIGYINKKTRVKKQTVIKKELDLDPSQSWLLSLGHGNVKIEIDGKTQTFHSTKSVRFLYSDGELKQLSIEEFKKLNKGRLW